MTLHDYLVAYSVTVLVITTVVGMALVGLVYAVIAAWFEKRRK